MEKEAENTLFTVLYQEHREVVYRFILRYLKSPALAEDLCQNVFVKLWEQREQQEAIRSPLAFALTIAKRASLDFLKRAAIDRHAMGVILQNYSFQSPSATDDNQRDAEYQKFLAEVLLRLPAQSQEVFRLCRQEYKSYDEAALILGISRHAIKKHMVRSMRVLKDAAKDELGLPLGMLFYLLSR